MLPFIYVIQHLFTSEITALITLLIYQINIQFVLPFLLVAMRLNARSEIFGDNLFKLFKAFPMQSAMSSIVYNTETLAALFRYRDQNVSGIGPDIETDENHPMNAPADSMWINVQFIFFWVLLLGVIEYRLLCFCCDPKAAREISKHDNDVYFGRENLSESKRGLNAVDDEMPNEDESDASEVAQIIGSGADLKLRFNVKFKPREELALKVENLRVVPRQGCCAWLCCCCKIPFDKIVVDSLAMQV